ncbi:MAG TPA: hypothetical protein VE713_01835 [Pyrinomonadaceae bacterium]|nr:hypothetical protein [Pyrinomonadaceae bacterium]
MSQKKTATKGKAGGSKKADASPLTLNYSPRGEAKYFEEYRRDGEYFAALLAEPDCPDNFRSFFSAIFYDEMLSRATRILGSPDALPTIYPIVRDAMDADGAPATADGLHTALVLAAENLVPDEVTNRVRERLGLTGKK